MALFKIFNNIDSKNENLPTTYTKGYMYYDAKKSLFYIDIVGEGGNTGIRQAINAWGAEKTINDSRNQQIDKTYIKGISISNNKLSYTLGDGTSHTVEGTLGAVTGVKGNAETTYRTGQINLTPADIGAATSGHTHTTTIATDSGTSQLTLAFGTKYKLTAGGTSYIFTMPANPDTNTASAVDNILDGSNSGTAITYAPYTSQQAKLSFDTSTTNPTRTDRLNLNGYLYATKLYSGGKEVLTAHQSLSNYKTKQTAVSSATAETSTATTFVYSVTQNDNGEITVKTRQLPTYNNYILPKATDSALGGIQTGYSSSGKNYAIKVDANGNAYVNVPWENTHQDISGKANLNSPAFTGTPTAPTAANGTNNTQIATTAFVMNAFTANDAMVFKGVLGTESGMIETLPTTHSQGWTYKVGTAGTYAGQVCEVGDTIYCVADGTAANNAHWVILQTNVDGTVIGPATSTADHIATFTGTTGKVIKDSGFTIATSVPANAKFTDTDTKVTSVDNHYTPSANTNSELTASLSGTTGSYVLDTEYTVLTGVKAQRDAKGHVTGLTYTAQKIKDTNTTYSSKTAASGGTAVSLVTTGEKYTWNNKSTVSISRNLTSGTKIGTITINGTATDLYCQTDTDTKVKQTAKTDSVEYKILTTTSASPTSGGAAEAAYSAGVTLNPSTNTLTASHFQVEHISGGNNEYRVTYGDDIDMSLMVGAGDANHGIYDWKASEWMVYADGSGNVTLNGNASTSSAVRDYNNNTLTKFGYSTAGMSSASWLGSWDATTSGEYRLRAITPANAIKSGIGTTAIGKASLPIYWDGSKFAAITSYEGKATTAGTADKATAANLTTTTNAIARYSNTTGAFANSGVTIDANNNITTPADLKFTKDSKSASIVFNSTTNALDFVFA